MSDDHLPDPLLQFLETLAQFLPQRAQRQIPGLMALLHQGRPDAEQARLDRSSGLLRGWLDQLQATWQALSREQHQAWKAGLSTLPAPGTGLDQVIDSVILALEGSWPEPTERASARAFVLALVELISVSPRLLRRQSQALGWGFERLNQRRLQQRLTWLPRALAEFEWLATEKVFVLEEPEAAWRRLQLRFADRPEHFWSEFREVYEVQRRWQLLAFVRRDKTDGQGHIRWFVTRHSEGPLRLERIGVQAYLRLTQVADEDIAAALAWATALDRVTALGLEQWTLLDASNRPRELRDERAARAYWRQRLAEGQPLRRQARASLSGDGAGDLRSWSVALVYVPSELEHPLGGVPEVGLKFLADRLEQQRARVQRFKLWARDFDQRLSDFDSFRAVGVGVYIHNRDQVADFCRRLRARGYRGRIILGGPELRTIEAVQSDFTGWDALLRGESEDLICELLRVFDDLDGRQQERAFERVSGLRGLVLRHDQELWLAHTATRNKAEAIRPPLPFEWSADVSEAASPTEARADKLKMNFTRGCPYLCHFCPNHQGRRVFSGAAQDLWEFSLLAVADRARLTPALQSLWRAHASACLRPEGPARESVRRLGLAFERALEAAGGASRALHWGQGWLTEEQAVSRAWSFKRWFLEWKLRLLAASALDWQPRDGVIIETSEDNTLVNKGVILEYLRRRREAGWAQFFRFNPGQNTIRDLLDRSGQVDQDFLNELTADNPFQVAFGTDGCSNAVLKQNLKPGYGVQHIMRVNKALGLAGVEAVNNYILLSPETSLLEALESLLLWLLLPVPWRDYGPAINLRVIKEDTTLATDEGLIFEPDDESWDVPLRDPELRAFLEDWSLTSMLPAKELRPKILEVFKDPRFEARLGDIRGRWLLNIDQDPELLALAHIWQGLQPEGREHAVVLELESLIAEHTLKDGSLVKTFSELQSLVTQEC